MAGHLRRTLRLSMKPQSGGKTLLLIQVAFIGDIPYPKSVKDVYIPPGDRFLPELPPVPTFDPTQGEKAVRSSKRLIEIRGPERTHNTLYYRQFGIITKLGGMLKAPQIEYMRKTINFLLEENENGFARWRIDAPWLPRTKVGMGNPMGTKGVLREYVTPVRAGRVLVEIGGLVKEWQVRHAMNRVCNYLPMEAEGYSQKELDELAEEEARIEKENVNSFSWEYCAKWNIGNCRSWMSEYDVLWKGKYR